jgi:quercetin dioxygenase-like cupin family protein
MATHYVGSYKDDAKREYSRHKGWVIGEFMADCPRQTPHMQIKYWEYSPDGDSHPLKQSSILECTFIIEGHITATINGIAYELRGGDYAVISPHTPNNLVSTVHKLTKGITIKAPGNPNDKTVIGSS